MNHKLGKRSRDKAAIMATGERCIYCGNPANRLEHMPPIGMFRKRDRPSGMEYPSCDQCNNGTSAADSVASFIARIDQAATLLDWRTQEAIAQRGMLDAIAPGFLDELFRTEAAQQTLVKREGIVHRMTVVKADGPLTKAYLNVFSAKLAMAMYREHVGEALPLDGAVQTRWYTNAGLSQETADGILKILPGYETLSQGRKRSSGQFDYRYNTDEKSIVAALVGFHGSLFVTFVATSKPDFFKLKDDGYFTLTSPGELRGRMPKVQPSKLLQLPVVGTEETVPHRTPAKSAE